MQHLATIYSNCSLSKQLFCETCVSATEISISSNRCSERRAEYSVRVLHNDFAGTPVLGSINPGEQSTVGVCDVYYTPPNDSIDKYAAMQMNSKSEVLFGSSILIFVVGLPMIGELPTIFPIFPFSGDLATHS